MKTSLIVPVIRDVQVPPLTYLVQELVHSGARLRIFLSASDTGVGHHSETIAPATITDTLAYDQDEWLVQTDLYVYVCTTTHAWLESARERERGVVALFHPYSETPDGEDTTLDPLLALAPYADLILVSSSQAEQILLQAQLCQPERIFIVPHMSYASPTAAEKAAYRFTLSRALTQVAVWTPLRDWHADEQGASSNTESTGLHTLASASAEDNQHDLFAIALAQIRSAATITLPDYQVRSPTPIVGSLIAWIRNHLTSHLQKPYFDPILQSQERFNWQATQALETIARQLAAHRRQDEPQQHADNGSPREKAHGEQHRRLYANAERLLEIVSMLETADITEHVRGQTDNRQTMTDLATLRTELRALLAELHDREAEA